MVKPSPEFSSSRIDDPKYKGVRKRKWGKWVSEIRLPNSRERIWLGSYNSPEKAARAFDAALFCLRGRNANFNFPNNPPDIVGGQSLTPQEIQAVASRFANEHEYDPPRDFPGSGREFPAGTSDSAARVDNETTMDWSFLNLLDSSNEGYSDFGFYSGFDNMGGAEPYRPPEPAVDDTGDENGGEALSHPSFLWNF